VTSIGVDGDGVLAVGVLAPEGALAGVPDDAGVGLDAGEGLDADDGLDADEAPPAVDDVSEFELPPLQPPMIAAMATATATTPTVKCPFIADLRVWRGRTRCPAIIVCDGFNRKKIVG
jgi:hypothetical protein